MKKTINNFILSNRKKFLRQDSKRFGEYMIVKLNMIHSYLKNFEYVANWYTNISNREAVQKGYDIPSIGASIPKI